MITHETVARINELARKSRTPEGLTEEEKAEQAVLRRAYIDSVLGSLQGQLDNTYLVDAIGHRPKINSATMIAQPQSLSRFAWLFGAWRKSASGWRTF